jgi:hypothetical protein
MQRHEREGNSMEEENIAGGEQGGSHGGRGEERAGGTATGAALTAGESLVRSGST